MWKYGTNYSEERVTPLTPPLAQSLDCIDGRRWTTILPRQWKEQRLRVRRQAHCLKLVLLCPPRFQRDFTRTQG